MNETGLISGKVQFIFMSTSVSAGQTGWLYRRPPPPPRAQCLLPPLSQFQPRLSAGTSGETLKDTAPAWQGKWCQDFPWKDLLSLTSRQYWGWALWGPGSALRGHGVGACRLQAALPRVYPASCCAASLPLEVGSQRPSCEEALCFCESHPPLPPAKQCK